MKQIFINEEFPQNCGDTLKVLKKAKVHNSAQSFFYECEFY